MAKQGIDLKAEMNRKLKEQEEQFQAERKKYEDRIEVLQKQVCQLTPPSLTAVNCLFTFLAGDGAEHDHVHDQLHDAGRLPERGGRVR